MKSDRGSGYYYNKGYYGRKGSEKVEMNARGRLIFNLTSNKAIAGFTKKMGANTAGVGVCFLSQKQWVETLNQTSLNLLKYSDDDKWGIPLKWQIFLHVGNIRCGHFWLSLSK
jgi:hypothetical protein